MNDAQMRLEASRARLRSAMLPPPVELAEVQPRPQTLLHRLAHLPTISAVLESVESWWGHHPLRPVSQLAGGASEAIVRPYADRHPLKLVLFAAVFGAGLVWSRPWRWLFRSALVAGLLPQLATRIVSSLPVESWITMAGSILSTPKAQPVQREVVTTPYAP
jgi:hypothetical protein